MDDTVRVVDELRDLDVELPGETLTIDFPARVPSAAQPRWDRQGVECDLANAWADASGHRWARVTCWRKGGAHVGSARVRPLSERRPGERCYMPVREAREDGKGVAQFWPCFVEMARPRPATRPAAARAPRSAAAADRALEYVP